MTTPPEPTPREKYLRDLLVTTLARLRRLEQGGAGMAEIKAEVRRTADLIAAQLGKGAGE